MNLKWRVWVAWALLVACCVAWPATALTVFREEPQGILGLSFLAIIITCLDVAFTADVRDKQEGEKE